MGKVIKSFGTLLVMSLPVWVFIAWYAQEKPTQVWVHLSEPNVKIFVGDLELRAESETAGPIDVSPGEHTLRITRGHDTLYSFPFTVEKGETKEIWAKWKPRGAQVARGGNLSEKGEQRLEGHWAAVSAISFSSDGRYVVSAGLDGTVRVWDAERAREVGTLEGHAGNVIAVSAQTGGRNVMTVGDDATVRIWDIATKKEVRNIQTGASFAARCAAVSPDGRFAAFGSDNSVIWVWDLEANAELQRHSIGAAAAGGLAFSPDGRTLLIGLVGDVQTPNDVEVFDVPTGRVITRLQGHDEPVWGVAFLPDGRRVVSAGSDRTLRLWDVATGRELKRFDDHPGVVLCLAVSPNGRLALTGTGHFWSEGWRPAVSYGLQIWDLELGVGLGRFETNEPIRSLALSPDGLRAMASGDDAVIHSWSLPPLPSHEGT